MRMWKTALKPTHAISTIAFTEDVIVPKRSLKELTSLVGEPGICIENKHTATANY